MKKRINTTEVWEELENLYKKFDYTQTDQSTIGQFIEKIKLFGDEINSLLAIYENITNEMIYASDSYLDFFGDDGWSSIHPDDFDAVIRCSVISLNYLRDRGLNGADYKLIRRYRAKVKDKYLVVIENLRAFEFDTVGIPWFSLVMIEIALNQSLPHAVEFKLLNCKTGEIIIPSQKANVVDKPIISERELEILSLIGNGLLSKEIANQLNISVHTVNTHRQNVLEKLKVRTIFEAIKSVTSMGMLQDT